MIIPDTNLLVYAYTNEVPQHTAARQWWENQFAGNESVGIPWVVSTGFVRLMTNPRVLTSPLSTSDAVGHVREWFQREHIMAVNPEDDHLTAFASNSSSRRKGRKSGSRRSYRRHRYGTSGRGAYS